MFSACDTLVELETVVRYSHSRNQPLTLLGSGSNVLPSDQGVPGCTVVNRARAITVEGQEVTAETGCLLQDLFLRTAQNSLAGLEFAVGIPGTLGGALVSNAGAYRSNISEFLLSMEIQENGERRWVEPSFMEFAYRDSVLRRPNPPSFVLLQVRLKLPRGNAKAIYDEARDYQRQRISKQPSPASAGSFFKNVNSQRLADSLDNLPERLRGTGVVPAGYLIEKAGLKGYRHKGAMFGERHANFILNVGNASASAIRELAELGKATVQKQFDILLEEEVLYLGDWSQWRM